MLRYQNGLNVVLQRIHKVHCSVIRLFGHTLLMNRLHILQQRCQRCGSVSLQALRDGVPDLLKKRLLPLPCLQKRVGGKPLLSGKVIVHSGDDGAAVGAIFPPIQAVQIVKGPAVLLVVQIQPQGL